MSELVADSSVNENTKPTVSDASDPAADANALQSRKSKSKVKQLSVNVHAEEVDDYQKPQLSPRWLAPNHVKTAALLQLYASVHLEKKKNDSLFFSKQASSTRGGLKFTKTSIREPLHFQALGGGLVKKGASNNKTLEGLRAAALESFRYIMFYMKDLSAKEAELGLAAQHMTDEVCRSKISQAGLTSTCRSPEPATRSRAPTSTSRCPSRPASSRSSHRRARADRSSASSTWSRPRS